MWKSELVGAGSATTLAVLIATLPGSYTPQDADDTRAVNRALAAQQTARHVWRQPCDGRTRVILTDGLPNGFLGLADRASCRVWVARWVGDDRELTCHVVMHELGHVAGVEHSANPRSVMYPRFDRIDRRCRTKRGGHVTTPAP